MQRLEVSCAVRPIYGSLGAKGLITAKHLKTCVRILHGLYREVQDYLKATFPHHWVCTDGIITWTSITSSGVHKRHCLPTECKLNMGATADHCWYYNSRHKRTLSNLQTAEYPVNTLQVKRMAYISQNKDKNIKIICRIHCFRRHICISIYKIPKFQRLLVDALKKNSWWQKYLCNFFLFPE
jgi:hypothetical protein